MMRMHNCPLLLLGGMFAALVLSGCEYSGLSGRDEELARRQSNNNFTVIEATAKHAVFAARKTRIVVEPPTGYCLDVASIAVTRSAAFALIAECLSSLEAELTQKASDGKVVEITLPRAFPGILTVSISAHPAYGAHSDALDAFEELLGSAAGAKLLSRGNNSSPGKIIATRRIGGALYVLIEEQAVQGAPFLALRFWRAFINVNERLVLVTVSSFADRPIAEDAMMGFLAQQMAVLRRANGQPNDQEESDIADNMAVALGDVDGQEGATVIRVKRAAAALARSDPTGAPMPPQRLASAGNGIVWPTPRNAPSRNLPGSAPSNSPIAPLRP